MHDRQLLARHPYCQHCGSVRTLGGDRALDVGGLANLLARFDRLVARTGRKVTEAQRRLILRRVLTREGDDAFGLSRAGQFRLLSTIIGETIGMSPILVEDYLRSA